MYSTFLIFFCYLYPATTEQPSIHNLSAPKGEFSEPSSPTLSSYELDLGFIAMVWKQPFSGEISEDPYEHLPS